MDTMNLGQALEYLNETREANCERLVENQKLAKGFLMTTMKSHLVFVREVPNGFEIISPVTADLGSMFESAFEGWTVYKGVNNG